MKSLSRVLFAALLVLPFAALADEYEDTIKIFRNADQSKALFKSAYGYAVFPTVGKGGMVVGAAHGSGRVYRGGKHAGDATMTQITVGAQLGGQAYAEIVLLQNKAAFDEFTSGNFEFGAQASAVAITAGASAQAGTTGASSSAGSRESRSKTRGGYHNGMAVFTAVKGGLMYEASVGGQKFSYTPLGKK